MSDLVKDLRAITSNWRSLSRVRANMLRLQRSRMDDWREKMTWKAITEQRFEQLRDNLDLRSAATDEIWAELLRMREILQQIEDAHYRMLGRGIIEGGPELSDEEYRRQCEGYRARGISTRGAR